MVTTDNGANIDFMDTDESITPQHYAFLVSESEFDKIFGQSVTGSSPTGLIPDKPRPMKLIATTGDVVSTSRTPTGTFWRSSRDRMAAAAGTRELGALPPDVTPERGMARQGLKIPWVVLLPRFRAWPQERYVLRVRSRLPSAFGIAVTPTSLFPAAALMSLAGILYQ